MEQNNIVKQEYYYGASIHIKDGTKIFHLQGLNTNIQAVERVKEYLTYSKAGTIKYSDDRLIRSYGAKELAEEPVLTITLFKYKNPYFKNGTE